MATIAIAVSASANKARGKNNTRRSNRRLNKIAAKSRKRNRMVKR